MWGRGRARAGGGRAGAPDLSLVARRGTGYLNLPWNLF